MKLFNSGSIMSANSEHPAATFSPTGPECEIHSATCTYQSNGENTRIKLSIPCDEAGPQNKVVFVCDTSGSMDGVPRQQTLNAVEQLEKDGLQFSVINYSDRAFKLDPPNVHQQLVRTWRRNCTNFCQAFEQIHECLETCTGPVDFVFMTDGFPSDQPLSTDKRCGLNLSELTEQIKMCKYPITIHTFGLGYRHDQNLLENIRQAGTIPGVYNYATPVIGGDEIANEIFTTVNFASRSQEIDVEIDGTVERVTMLREDNHLVGELWLDRIPKTMNCSMNQTHFKLSPTMTPVDLSYQTSLLRHRIFSIQSAEECIELQKEIDATKVVRVERAQRSAYIEEINSVQLELDNVRSIFLNKFSQSELAARLHALSFRGKLSKARRQRTMDDRAIKNCTLLQTMEDKLKELYNSEIADIKCDLHDDIGQLSLLDIMKDMPDDLLVLGVSAWRDEVVIDQPVCMSAQLSTTMLSFSTFETGALFKIDQVGQNSATGSFDYTQLAEVMKGTSNETINACLPIYGCDEHYQRARTMLPLICGLFFTLSESGYHPKQIPALYAILARLHRQVNSDRHQEMVEGYRQFCAALLRDDEILIEMKVPQQFHPFNIIKEFCTNVSSHQKSELPTLDILYGCILAAGKDFELPDRFSSILLCEVIRRKFNDKLQGEHPDRFRDDAIKMITPDVDAPDVEVKDEPCFVVEIDAMEQTPKNVSDIFESTLKGTFQKAIFEPYQPPRMHRRRINFHFIPSNCHEYTDIPNLKLTEDEFKLVHYAAVLQACLGWHNDRFRTLIDENYAILDPLDADSVEKLRKYIWEKHRTNQEQRWTNLVEKQRDVETATYLIHGVDDIAMFAWILNELNVTHGQNLWTEIINQMFSDGWEHISLYEDKLAILLSGEYLGDTIIESGIWMAGERYGTLCRERLIKTHEDLLNELDEMVVRHHYREKPNRCGHCAAYPLWGKVKAPGYTSKVPFDERMWQMNVSRLVKKWDV